MKSGKFQYLKPCPICGSTDGRCRKIDELYLCMEYVNGEAANEVWKYKGITKDWNWGIYCLWGDERETRPVFRGFIKSSSQNSTIKHSSRSEKDNYFQWLLKKAPLTTADRELLIKKGLNESEISSNIFGSVHGGILIVIKDVYKRKIAAQIRRRDISKGQKISNRYYWHTSKKHPSIKLENNQIPIAVWQSKDTNDNILNMCEGYLKSYIVSCQYKRLGENYPWIGFGAASYLNSAIEEIKKTIKVLKPKILRFYPDAGSADNPNVCRHYQTFWNSLTKAFPDLTIEVASWGQEFNKNAPDLDELQDKSQIKLIPLAEYQIKFKNREGYPKENRLNFWKEKLKTNKFILDSSPTGTGKSYDAGCFDEPALYLSVDHRNPTTESIKEWQDVEARHGGLTYDKHGYLRRTSDSIEAQVPSNCILHKAHHHLRENGYNSSFLCLKCEYFEKCQKEIGEGYGYLAQRRNALMAKQIRIHPDSLPKIDKFDYENRTLIIEEAGELPMVSQLTLKEKDLINGIEIINDCLTLPVEIKNQLAEYLERLRKALDTQIGSKYGGINREKPPNISLDIQLSLWSLCDPEEDLSEEVASEEWEQAKGYEKYKLTQINNALKRVSTDLNWIRGKLSQKLHLGILWLILGHSSWISERRTIHVYRVKEEIREIIRKAKNVIFLDATANRERIALLYGIPAQEILQISCYAEEPQNLTIEQISDLGKLCRNRGKDQLKRLEELLNFYKAQEPNTRIIDLLSYSSDACWWRDSRGRNSFTTCKQLILVGLPARNLLHSLCEFTALGGNPCVFQRYYNEQIQNDIIQGIGRLRSHCRPNEQLKIIIITNFPLPGITAKQTKSTEICQQAAPKVERKIMKIVEIYQELEKSCIKPTQTAIAQQLGIARETVCRCWEKVKKALKQLNHTPVRTCEKTESAIHEQALGIIETFEEFKEYNPKESRQLVLYILNEIPNDELGKNILYHIYNLKGINWIKELEKLIDSS